MRRHRNGSLDSFLCAFLWAILPAIASSQTIIVDNNDGPPSYIEAGSWTTSAQTGFNGGSYRFTNFDDPPSSATWTPNIPTSGTYEVYSIFRSGANRTNDAPYAINHAGGQNLVHIDMTGAGDIVEVQLGDFPFTTGTAGSVTLSNRGGAGFYIADAIRFRNLDQDDPPVISLVNHSLPIPRPEDAVVIFALITDDRGVTSTTLSYTIPLDNYTTRVRLFDDGLGDDKIAGDGFYGAMIPPLPPNTEIRYRFAAADTTGQLAQSEEVTYVVGRSGQAAPGVLVLAGQSNASGRGVLDANNETSHPQAFMFGNDYHWKIAFEPVDDPTGQIDLVSLDTRITSSLGHSFGLRAAKDTLTTSRSVYVIPCPLGGTRLSQWQKPVNPLDRNTLFGSMNFRRLLSAPGGVTALWWYQGESDAGSNTYREDHTAFIADVRDEMGPDLPVMYVQLAKHTVAGTNSGLHRIGEQQRQLETGSGTQWELTAHHMVVAFDLPLGEPVHLNRTGLVELGRRIALATREHVYGESVEGTGPRLARVQPLVHPEGDKGRIRVRFDKAINEAVDNYDHQFRAFDNGNEIAVKSVSRDPSDARSLLISLNSAATGVVSVSYGDVAAPGLGVWLHNDVQGTSGLPAPRFGPLSVDEKETVISHWEMY
ncbi:MAG: sialate O-acetylesterase [bacterium]